MCLFSPVVPVGIMKTPPFFVTFPFIAYKNVSGFLEGWRKGRLREPGVFSLDKRRIQGDLRAHPSA